MLRSVFIDTPKRIWKFFKNLLHSPLPSSVEVGWLIDAEQSSVIWEAPRPFKRTLGPAYSAKAMQRCPAIADYESRFIEVLCPFDLHLRLVKKNGWQLGAKKC